MSGDAVGKAGGMSESTHPKTCKHGEVNCGRLYDCGRCAREKMARAYRLLTPEQRAYDSLVDPACAYHHDFPPSCSCHINAPCYVCVGNTDEE